MHFGSFRSPIVGLEVRHFLIVPDSCSSAPGLPDFGRVSIWWFGKCDSSPCALGISSGFSQIVDGSVAGAKWAAAAKLRLDRFSYFNHPLGLRFIPSASGLCPSSPRRGTMRQHRTHGGETFPNGAASRDCRVRRQPGVLNLSWPIIVGTPLLTTGSCIMPFTSMELMICCAARELEDGKTVAVGTGPACAAAMLAQRTHAPNLVIAFRGRRRAPQLPTMPVSVGDSTTFHRAVMATSMADVMQFCQRGMVDYTFLGGARSTPTATSTRRSSAERTRSRRCACPAAAAPTTSRVSAGERSS